MNQDWSKEPWDVDSDGELVDAEGINLIGINAYKDMRDIADAKRVVVCVNALRGIPTEELETTVLGGLVDRWERDNKKSKLTKEWLALALVMRK